MAGRLLIIRFDLLFGLVGDTHVYIQRHTGALQALLKILEHICDLFLNHHIREGEFADFDDFVNDFGGVTVFV